MKNVYIYDSPIGKILIADNGEKITNIYFKDETFIKEDWKVNETELIKKTYNELIEYFNGKRKSFDIPLAPIGTEFQMKCWKALQEIPYGETKTYGEIAEIIGNPKASRAVGSSNNKNPISIIIPCHRVIGANGKLVGYAGGLHVKEYLLNLERRVL
ncbi:MAG: methylated-DNA--[protein]-cysteine S-methyltransferase [Solirubrobacterales bacterium]